MNILYIHTHDTGRYIEPYGYHIPTPNLMKLAYEGTLFRNAYNIAPTCSPSRAGLLTGMYPHSCGMLGLAHRGFQLNDYRQHIVSFLNENGYETVLCGVQHEAPKKEMIGYQRILNEEIVSKTRTVPDLLNAHLVADYFKEEKAKPFFLSFGMFNTHREFPAIDADVNSNYVMPPFPMADNEKNREDMAAFISSAKIVDQCVGIVLDALKQSGQEEDTFVIFTTDHGIAFPGMKCNLYDTGIGVSQIFKYPGNKRKGEAVDVLASHIDIFPTLCEILQLDQPNWLQGVSMMPYMNREVESIREEIFSEVTFHAAYEPMRCIRNQRFKFIKYFDEHVHYVPANMDDSFSKSFVMKSGYFDRIRDMEQLFDLSLDPVERVNLIGNDRYKEIYTEMKKHLFDWMKSTDDPLLNGKVLLPAGAFANTLECLSPNDEDYVMAQVKNKHDNA